MDTSSLPFIVCVVAIGCVGDLYLWLKWFKAKQRPDLKRDAILYLVMMVLFSLGLFSSIIAGIPEWVVWTPFVAGLFIGFIYALVLMREALNRLNGK